ncbi:MAG: D-sedoheptulose 7-phosphate isomerase [Pseudomonadota bacterium]
MSLTASILDAHLLTVERLKTLAPEIERTGRLLTGALQAGHKIMLCGNGGSAADAQHIAAELVCRFESTRRGLPAIALTTDTSALTAIGNDFGFERIFARQVEALGQPGDILIALSTSGNSTNVTAAVAKAREMGIATLGLLGKDGGELLGRLDQALVVPTDSTARIQECHILIGHIWCAIVDAAFS